ncbi:hypothetical protein [Mucilaginibacter sp. OK098]|uniref:hypothetical protein n=1 Tax=Mucilaginibacter sp. OK098 TaxID=1855297 RepID=UPI00092396CF|nr:hypothetical protein [Mucilaginibacter sp. OK098]SHN26194.1 hypothetical protein SAMN05216524_107389 [Mucilaginibacter sp. OK098]
MKVLSFILCLTLWYTAASAQGSAESAEARHIGTLKAQISPTINTAISTISKGIPIDAVKDYFKDNKNIVTLQKADGIMYKYKMLFGRDENVLQVRAKSDVTDIDYLKLYDNVKADEYTFQVVIRYQCTDPKHNPKHEAKTCDAMQQIQKDNGCSGYTMLITDIP